MAYKLWIGGAPRLFWGTIAAIPMMFPLLFMTNVSVALAGAAPIGLVGGLAGAAYFDLIISSSPAGLQGNDASVSAGDCRDTCFDRRAFRLR